MREYRATTGKEIRLGRSGESHARCVLFDVSEWQRVYGEGSVHLIHQRNGDACPYPCQITVDGGYVSWVVTSADVAVAGRGRAELQYRVGDACVKSEIYATTTMRSMSEAGETPPEPEAGWVSQVLGAADDAVQSAQQAQEAVDRYPKVQDGTWWVWDAAQEAFVDTGTVASGVYVGSGDMPDGCSLQIDPNGEVLKQEDLIGPQGPRGEHGIQGVPGKDGADGAPGKDGGYYTPSFGPMHGTTMEVAFIPSDPDTMPMPDCQFLDLPPGPEGYTPEKGKDYFTQEEVDQIVADAAARVEASFGGTYELVEEITTTEDLTSVRRAAHPDGTPYNFKSMIIKMEFAVGAGTGLVNVNFSDKDGWALGVSSTNTIATNKRWAWTRIFRDYDRWHCEFSVGSTQYAQAIYRQVGSNEIFGAKYGMVGIVNIVANTSGIPIPAGTIIRIYGVRA